MVLLDTPPLEWETNLFPNCCRIIISNLKSLSYLTTHIYTYIKGVEFKVTTEDVYGLVLAHFRLASAHNSTFLYFYFWWEITHRLYWKFSSLSIGI